jgi:hypothetical protein
MILESSEDQGTAETPTTDGMLQKTLGWAERAPSADVLLCFFPLQHVCIYVLDQFGMPYDYLNNENASLWNSS